MKSFLSENEIKNLVKSVINEMGPRDWRLKSIMQMFDDSKSNHEKRKISLVVVNNTKCDRDEILDALHDFDHDEMSEVAQRLGLYND
jgi:hypothetical protein